MDSKICFKCGQEFPSSSMMRLDGEAYCANCGEQVLTNLHAEEAAETSSASSTCVICGLSGATPRYGGSTPICDSCAPKVYQRDFPGWLKSGLVVALVLLVVALAHGAKYFKAGRSLYRSEKLIAANKYQEAGALLTPVVAMAPDCKKCSLLLAKAELLAGDPDIAFKAVENKNYDNDDALFNEVNGMFSRVNQALPLIEDAAKKMNDDKDEEALAEIREAKKLYPELRGMARFEGWAEAGVAFNHKDYDKFLEIEQAAAVAEPNDASAHAAVASAFACKYAVSGNEEFKQKALASLTKASVLAASDKSQLEQFNQYSERIQHRLKTREIITAAEYDKRFHPERLKKEDK